MSHSADQAGKLQVAWLHDINHWLEVGHAIVNLYVISRSDFNCHYALLPCFSSFVYTDSRLTDLSQL